MHTTFKFVAHMDRGRRRHLNPGGVSYSVVNLFGQLLGSAGDEALLLEVCGRVPGLKRLSCFCSLTPI